MFFMPLRTTFAAGFAVLDGALGLLVFVALRTGEAVGATRSVLAGAVTGATCDCGTDAAGFARAELSVGSEVTDACGAVVAVSAVDDTDLSFVESASPTCSARRPKYLLSVSGIVNSNPYLR